ncbi:hypothetical protein ABTZ59_11835 [Streptomyces sp. NPDC094034]|uniref:hypothetical protein n=1 Tax=Streptomyces sp. NPDC094034 TaxID=3155309 RepID=UPI0033275A8A
MSRSERGVPDWQIGLAPNRSVSRERRGQLALTLQIVRPGEKFVTVPLVLTVAEAEGLHAALCYALNAEPVPDDAPECRKSIQYSGSQQRF